MDSGGRGVHGVVLAGSYPWRNAPLERLRPRPLLPVAHVPAVSYALRWLADAGVGAATICVNSASRRVQAELPVRNERWPSLDYYQDETPRGPAGCLRDAAAQTDADTFVVVDGASLPALSLSALLEHHCASGADGTVAVEATAAGAPRASARALGTFVFGRAALEHVPWTGFQDIKEHLLPRLYAAGKKVVAHAAAAPSPRVMDVESYLAANEWAMARFTGGPGAGDRYCAIGEARVHRTAGVHADARLLGPVLVGPETRVLAGATIVGPVVLGARCVVEERAVVSRSVCWDRCLIGGEAFVDGAVLADDARVAAFAHVSQTVHVSEQAGELLPFRFRGRRHRAWAWRPWVAPSARS